MYTNKEKRYQENELTAKKIKLVYKYICHENIEELYELFANEKKQKIKDKYSDNRKRWLRKLLSEESVGSSYLKKEFRDLNISKVYMNNQLLFDEDKFFNSDLEMFKNYVDKYMEYLRLSAVDIDLEYRYIYLYDEKLKKIVYYQVIYSDIKLDKSQKELPIKVYPPSCKKDCGEYIGTIKKRKNQMVLVFENSYDMIHIIFNSLLEKKNNIPILEGYYGLAIGVDDQNKQTPLARKVMFCKKKLDQEEKEIAYLILNETQTLEAKESIFLLDSKVKLDADYIAKYYQNVKNMHTFFSNIKYSSSIDTSILHHMVFTEFHVYQKMFEKFSFKQDYYLRDRKRVCLEFIRFLQSHNDRKVMLSLPIFEGKDNIFLMENYEKKSIKALFVELAEKGMDIEIVFIIEKREDYDNAPMKKISKELHKSGIKLYFVKRRDIERKVSSFDFCCTLKGVDAIYKSQINLKEMFTITRNREVIKNLIVDFKRLCKFSYSYEDIESGKKVLTYENKLLKKIVGKWFIYFYGSYNFKDGTPVFWNIDIEVKHDLTIVEYGKDELGYGRVEFYKDMVFASIVSSKNESTFYMIIDQDKISEVMSVMLYSKQEQTKLDISTIAILSRIELTNDEAKVLLGNSEENILKESTKLKNRVDKFVLSHKATILNS